MARPDNAIHDVIQIGYGPVSAALAIMLGRLGFTVAVLERWKSRYPLPRAVCIDHELYRVLCAIGLRDALPAITHSAPVYRWFNAEWRELLAIDWSAESVSGGPEVHFVHQPTLEELFDQAVRAQPGVAVHLGSEAVAIREEADHVAVTVRDGDGGNRIVRGRFLVGVDGANSLVRHHIGSGQEDRGFEADWLVIDILPHQGVALDIPAAAQLCDPVRPTTIVPAGIRNGRYFRRWEFMRLPHETREELEDEAMAWRLLRPWVTPDQAAIVRHKVYTFRSLLADRWRRGRILIAGDAAHVMPPFMGQGMCAGLRDAWNLAWKLDLVRRGQADDRLLDTYQPERRPHASDIIDISMYLGKIICIPDPEEAARRDRAFLDGLAPPPPPFPQLTDGLLDRWPDGRIRGPAGLLGPHGTIRLGGRDGRFDDLAGLGFRIVVAEADAGTVLQDGHREILDGLDARVLRIERPGTPAPGAAVDLDGKILPFMARHGLAAMAVRPDFYLYGGAGSLAELPGLVDRLAAGLALSGCRPASVPPLFCAAG
ncbi:bifunctional 3-(3-hydroxy-phenyl)propionate/3-hydroxycinnamic acid hydroxylase MhpA [Inquilinus sp. CA228]|uniref:bifunctional 3-(3-hydroxy-phenyl)propionate/3-hydroxycinnamic acid hydroxylase MhpA n=1 Tax=Inquilinus sp. CA228 TaxID=3455609 RepID=UPI003F8D1E42